MVFVRQRIRDVGPRSQLPLNKQKQRQGHLFRRWKTATFNPTTKSCLTRFKRIPVQVDVGQVLGYGSHRPLSSFFMVLVDRYSSPPSLTIQNYYHQANYYHYQHRYSPSRIIHASRILHASQSQRKVRYHS